MIRSNQSRGICEGRHIRQALRPLVLAPIKMEGIVMLPLREGQFSPQIQAEMVALGFEARRISVLPLVLGITAILDVCATVSALVVS
jgi:hypothetical protein